MCGINGVASAATLASVDWVELCNTIQSHRGPDHNGIWVSNNQKIALGHQRLSILDLSISGNQPMRDAKNNTTLIFNGEIYNYKELKKILTENNYQFNTHTDTEVILVAYRHWGIDFLNKLIGMFAIVIVDQNKNKVFLCRDRAGEKPIYYQVKNKSIYFSSELKSLLKNKDIRSDISSLAIDTYFSLGYLPGSLSILSDTSKVLPGEYLSFDLINGEYHANRYWNIDTEDKVQTKDTLYDSFEDLMKSSVRLQLHADVPVGLLLSGGVDSTIICYIASLLNKNIKTYTLTNKESPDIDEGNYASNIASFLGTKHTSIDSRDISGTDILNIIDLIDEPFSDSSFIPTFLLTKEIKKHCTVALGGDGADELFGGYRSYQMILKYQSIINHLSPDMKNKILKLINTIFPLGFKGRNFVNRLLTNIDHYRGNLLFDKLPREKLLKIKNIHVDAESYLSGRCVKSNKNLVNMMQCDFNNYLPDDILFKTDRASMLNSLELRSPFLDKRIINFSSKLKQIEKTSASSGKLFLKNYLSLKFPSDYNFNRKQGFSIPLSKWLTKEYCSDVLGDIKSNDPIIEKKYINKLIKSLKYGYSNHERIYNIIVFHRWRKNFNIGF